MRLGARAGVTTLVLVAAAVSWARPFAVAAPLGAPPVVDGVLTYSVTVGTQGQALPRIVEMNPDGTGERRLLFHGRDLAWSPDGLRVVYQSERSGLFVADADGGNSRWVAPRAEEPAWSPDGTTIAYARRGHVWLVGADGTDRRQVTSGDGTDISPTWPPDGSQIAFLSDRPDPACDPDCSFDVFVMNADGTGVHDVLPRVAWQHFPAWAPDGTWIAFLESNGFACPFHDREFVVHPDGSGLDEISRDLPPGPSYGGPVWSPDGRVLTFSSDVCTGRIHSGRYEWNPRSEKVRLVPESFAGSQNDLAWQPLVCSRWGTAGPDVVQGTPGHDVVCGLGGNDVLQGNGGDDTIVGGSGRDLVTYADAPHGVTVDLSKASATGWGTDRLIGVQDVDGSSHDDVLIGDRRRNRLSGGGGNDHLNGGRAENGRLRCGRGFLRPDDSSLDVLAGGPGDDVLRGTSGLDQLFGDSGDDLCIFGIGGSGCDRTVPPPGPPAQAVLPTVPIRPQVNGLIAFTNGTEVFTVRPDGTDRRVVFQDASEPSDIRTVALSPDGSHLLVGGFVGSTAEESMPRTFVMDPDGSHRQQVRNVFPYDWTPDGSRLVFNCRQALWTVRPDGRNSKRLVHTAGYLDVISPDGSRIAYVAPQHPPTDSSEIWVMRIDRTHHRLLRRIPGNVTDLQWSPDGARIFFVENMTVFDRHLWFVDSQGGRLHTTPIETFEYALSPDGTRVVWQGPRGALVSSRLNGSDPIRIAGAGQSPDWQPLPES